MARWSCKRPALSTTSVLLSSESGRRIFSSMELFCDGGEREGFGGQQGVIESFRPKLCTEAIRKAVGGLPVGGLGVAAPLPTLIGGRFWPVGGIGVGAVEAGEDVGAGMSATFQGASGTLVLDLLRLAVTHRPARRALELSLALSVRPLSLRRSFKTPTQVVSDVPRAHAGSAPECTGAQ